MSRKDVIFIAAVLAFSAIMYPFFSEKKSADTVIIKKDGKLYGSYPLHTDRTADIDGKNTVVIKNGEVYMEYADCPDKLCIKQGKISGSEKKIICLPNKVTVEVTKKSGIDAVVR